MTLLKMVCVYFLVHKTFLGNNKGGGGGGEGGCTLKEKNLFPRQQVLSMLDRSQLTREEKTFSSYSAAKSSVLPQ